MINCDRLDLADGLLDHAEGMMRRYYQEEDSDLSDASADRLIDQADKLCRIATVLRNRA